MAKLDRYTATHFRLANMGAEEIPKECYFRIAEQINSRFFGDLPTKVLLCRRDEDNRERVEKELDLGHNFFDNVEGAANITYMNDEQIKDMYFSAEPPPSRLADVD